MKITPRIAAEIAGHEGIVLEAYRDSVNVWTWGVGVTSASGHSVERYKDNPQTLERVIEVFQWLLTEKYLPAVERAFRGYPLTESQLAGALSFHWNTGAIERASWVKHWKAGNIAAAKKSFMDWKRPAEIIPRRRAERDLFFDGKWHGGGMATVYPVRKPSYTPHWSQGRRVNVLDALSAPKAAAAQEVPSQGFMAALVAMLARMLGKK